MNLTKEDFKIILFALNNVEIETVGDAESIQKTTVKIRQLIKRKKNEVALMLNISEIETGRNIFRRLADEEKKFEGVEFISEELKNPFILSISEKLENLADVVNLPKDEFI